MEKKIAQLERLIAQLEHRIAMLEQASRQQSGRRAGVKYG